MKKNNHHCHSFDRYKGKFEPVRKRCSCGGRFDCVHLTKSDRNKLVLLCSNDTCPSITLAHRISNGPAFDGADEPRPTL